MSPLILSYQEAWESVHGFSPMYGTGDWVGLPALHPDTGSFTAMDQGSVGPWAMQTRGSISRGGGQRAQPIHVENLVSSITCYTDYTDERLWNYGLFLTYEIWRTIHNNLSVHIAQKNMFTNIQRYF